MADLTKQGQWRTDRALRQLEIVQYETTGQLPPRQRMPSVFWASFVSMLSARPATKPRRRVERVVEVERSRCGLCQNKLVQAVFVLCLAWFAAVGINDTIQRNQDVQTHERP